MKRSTLVKKNQHYNNAVLEAYKTADLKSFTKSSDGLYELDSKLLLRSSNIYDKELVLKTSERIKENRLQKEERKRLANERHEEIQQQKLAKINEHNVKYDQLSDSVYAKATDRIRLYKDKLLKQNNSKIEAYQNQVEPIATAYDKKIDNVVTVIYPQLEQKIELTKTKFDQRIENTKKSFDQKIDLLKDNSDLIAQQKLAKLKDDKERALTRLNTRKEKVLQKLNYNKIQRKEVLVKSKEQKINSINLKIDVLREKNKQIERNKVSFFQLKNIFFKKNIGALVKSVFLDDDRRTQVRENIIKNFNEVHIQQESDAKDIKTIKDNYKKSEILLHREYLKKINKFNTKIDNKLNKKLFLFLKKKTKKKIFFSEKVYSFIVKQQDKIVRIKKLFENLIYQPHRNSKHVEEIGSSKICYDYKGNIKYLQVSNVNDFNKITETIGEQTEPIVDTHYQHTKKIRDKISNKLINNALYILVVLYVIAITIKNPSYLSMSNIVNIINQLAFYLPVALGVGGIIVLTGTDLSAGRIMGFTAMILLSLEQSSPTIFPGLTNFPIILGIIIVLAIGALLGFVNGFFTAKFKIHPFIVTLATSLVIWGIMIWYLLQGKNQGVGLFSVKDSLLNITTYNLFGTGIQLYVVYVIILLFITYILWNKTSFGKNMFAVGSNPEAATVSGISVFKTTILVFIFAGIVYGFQGFVAVSYIGSINANTGFGFELDAITACVVGGVSFTGGVGKIRGIFIGVLILVLFQVSVVFARIDPAFVYIIKGLLVLVATTIDMRKYIVKK